MAHSFNKDVSGIQLRAARALLGWSGNELSKRSGVGLASIRRFENGDFSKAIASTRQAVINALEKQGIEFTGTVDKNPGVTLHRAKSI